MKEILSTLHILLKDIIMTPEARRTQQNVLWEAEQPLTIFDVKKAVFEQYETLQKKGSFSYR